jgi:hypothetical protein
VGSPTQDKRLAGAKSAQQAHSLHYILDSCTETKTEQKQTQISQEPAIQPYRRFAHRLGHRTTNGLHRQRYLAEAEIIQSDPAIQAYFDDLKGKRGNKGIVTDSSIRNVRSSVRQFLAFTGIEISNHAIFDLVTYKRDNPKSSDIEQALRAFSVVSPIKTHAAYGSCILGIFRANFARLDLRINNHFEPAIENCKFETFLEILNHCTDEQKDMVQWGTYYPERSTATYCIPFSAFTKGERYAIGFTETHHPDYRNKSKVRHPIIIPIAFFNEVETKAKSAGREAPFPNYHDEWRKIAAFAKSEHKVRLVSNYTRKLYERMAARAKLNPAIAAFMMGDKTKLQDTGHLPLIYNTDLRDVDEIARQYEESGVLDYLDLSNKGEPKQNTRLLKALKRIKELEEALARKG